MKKLILIVLAAALTLTLCACGAKKDALTTAQEMIGEDISSLTAAIGEPQQKLYEASCSGPGDDGIWIYDGVTVFTYLENGVETVVDAE